MSFFGAEEAHAVVPAHGKDEGGLPWRDDTGILSCFATSWVNVALNKVLSCQACPPSGRRVWARGELL